MDFRPKFIAGDAALDFLNTRMKVEREIQDFFRSGEDVLIWLERAGFRAHKEAHAIEPQLLLRAARTLRENIRFLVEKRKAGRRGDPSVLNHFLRHAQSYPQLVWSRPHSPAIERIRQLDRPEAILSPVAEAAALLLATADFSRVKRCEDQSCILWFSDRTKSCRRRWCSMEICGNRHKVAAYRARHRDRSISAG